MRWGSTHAAPYGASGGLARRRRPLQGTDPATRATSDPTLFLLIEVYADAAALEAHRQSAHYEAFREDTKDWVTDRKWWFWAGVGADSP